jgi:c-di-GMP-binding flagellar brake protein YcgR
MTDQDEKDRRHFERLERRDDIKIKEFRYPERGRYQKARIVDISGGGLQIEAKQHFAQDTVLKIEMNFTGWQRYTHGFLKYFGTAAARPLIVLAEVVRCDLVVPGRKYEIALRFSGIDESQREALIRFIKAEILSKH